MGVLSLIAKLGLDASGFHRGIKQSESAVSKFGKNATGALKGQLAAAFGTAAVVSATKDLVDYASKIDDLSNRLGISRTALQEFDYAAAQNSGTLDDVTRSLEKLSVARRDALRNDKGDIGQAFRELGISADDLKKKRIEELIKDIANSFQKAGDTQQKMGATMKVLGESGNKLIPSFLAGFDALAKLAHDTGTIIEDDAIDPLRALGDEMTEVKFRARALFSEAIPGFIMLGKVMNYALLGPAALAHVVGSLTAGSSIKSAGASAATEIAAGNQRRSDAEKAREELRRRRSQVGNALLNFDYSTDTAASKTATKGPGLGFSANSLQQIGAYVGQNPILFESKQQTKVLLKVSKTLEQIERAQRLTGGGFLA